MTTLPLYSSASEQAFVDQPSQGGEGNRFIGVTLYDALINWDLSKRDETAKLVAVHAPITLEVTKEAVRRIRRTLSREEGEDLILRAYMSEDFREGMDAFLNKRPARGETPTLHSGFRGVPHGRDLRLSRLLPHDQGSGEVAHHVLHQRDRALSL